MNLKWTLNRLRVMSIPEITWRLSQDKLSRREKRTYSNKLAPVYSCSYCEVKISNFNYNDLGLNSCYRPNSVSSPFGWYHGRLSYDDYGMNWNIPVDGTGSWPTEEYFSSIDFDLYPECGDFRMNWEICRNSDFVALAKNYYCTGDTKWLSSLENRFARFNQECPWLHGIAWVSPMEYGVRALSWVYAAGFLCMAGLRDTILVNNLLLGACNMAKYVSLHYSQYSSANNHLIIEMVTLGIVGIAFRVSEWIDLSKRTLTTELSAQTCSDGMNAELSLYYHTWVLEGLTLLAHVSESAGSEVFEFTRDYISRMAAVLDAHLLDNGEILSCGDADDGWLLNIACEDMNYYEYVLQCVNGLLKSDYGIGLPIYESVLWLYPLNCFSGQSRNTRDSLILLDAGYTLIRGDKGKTLLLFDFGKLGYGKIAAHGHADSLSIQFAPYGKPLIIDPGSFQYNGSPNTREWYRSSDAHSTVVFNGNNQSQYLGPFLWGAHAVTKLTSVQCNLDGGDVSASCVDVEGCQVERRVIFDSHTGIVEVVDSSYSDKDMVQSFHLSPETGCTLVDDSHIELRLQDIVCDVRCSAGSYFLVNEEWVSRCY